MRKFLPLILGSVTKKRHRDTLLCHKGTVARLAVARDRARKLRMNRSPCCYRPFIPARFATREPGRLRGPSACPPCTGGSAASSQYLPTYNTHHYTHLFEAVSGVQGTPGRLLIYRRFRNAELGVQILHARLKNSRGHYHMTPSSILTSRNGVDSAVCGKMPLRCRKNLARRRKSNRRPLSLGPPG